MFQERFLFFSHPHHTIFVRVLTKRHAESFSLRGPLASSWLRITPGFFSPPESPLRVRRISRFFFILFLKEEPEPTEEFLVASP